jgi:hypothetical protein
LPYFIGPIRGFALMHGNGSATKTCRIALGKRWASLLKAGKAKEVAVAVAKVKPSDSELKEKLARAKTAIRPDVGAAFVISEFGGHLDVAALAVQLEIGMNGVRTTCGNARRCCIPKRTPCKPSSWTRCCR